MMADRECRERSKHEMMFEYVGSNNLTLPLYMVAMNKNNQDEKSSKNKLLDKIITIFSEAENMKSSFQNY